MTRKSANNADNRADNRWLLLLAGFVLLLIAFSPNAPKDFVDLARIINWRKTVVDPKPVDPKPVTPTPSKLTSREEALKLITADDIKQYVTRLAASDIAGRGTGQPGADKAADYIMARLDRIGVPYLKQPFHTSKGTATNIIGYLMPDTELDDRILVVGAHYDHLGGTESRYYPGADDNASGTAGVLEIAEALHAVKHLLKHTVLLQFYSAEEIGLVGSAYYCNNPMFPRAQPDIKKHAAMINLDMIGYLRSSDIVTPKEMERICGGKLPEDYTAAELNLKNFVGALADKYPFANRIAGYRPGGSDHAPFYRKGIPVVFLHTGSHPHYHKVTDTPDRVNYAGAESVSRLAFELALSIEGAMVK